jgi:hypothetical protein
MLLGCQAISVGNVVSIWCERSFSLMKNVDSRSRSLLLTVDTNRSNRN